ncbi:MAG: hypothetical protein HYZ42_01580, partial [Bacteroidetes bacterium]|nr:hypothetical protein [Bacteroidota bacterium]
HKKVCGILIENSLTAHGVSKSIIGIGMNILQQQFAPTNTIATSFYMQSHRQYSVDSIYEKLLQSLDTRYIELKSGWHQKQRNEYINCLYKLNEKSLFIIDNKEILGIIKNIDDFGRLIVEIEGQNQHFQNGEIKMIY